MKKSASNNAHKIQHRMVHYFYVLPGPFFERLRRDLGDSWRQRSFGPCLALCRELAASQRLADESLVALVAGGARFDRNLWHALVGECLIDGADAMPCLETAPRSLLCLLAPERLHADPAQRDGFSPIEQIHFGSQDLRLGSFYRPDYVGLNDADDIARLTRYLANVDPSLWTPDHLRDLPDLADDADRGEELAYVRDWWPALCDLYAERGRGGAGHRLRTHLNAPRGLGPERSRSSRIDK